MKISIVGSGNVAWHLSQALEDAGHWICEIYSRNPHHAALLAAQLYDTDVVDSLNFSESPAELILLAISDHALDEVMQQIVLPENTILVNTSGTTTLAALQNLVDIYSDVDVQTGIFYPLQTFTKGVPLNYNTIPFCIESRDKETEERLISLAETISGQVKVLNSYERLVYHVAAVFASNFTTHLLAISHHIVQNEDLDFELLKPLISATIEKALSAEDPAEGLTGPALRGDSNTLDRHLEYLEEADPNISAIYSLLTHHIQESQGPNS
ncbi:Rossmann-like and DUF2520 domain-containing protein [Dyadobacter tibetensis]|uniref:Rossmann-like and DUF2520 domain-containing protein n=1 Tax=Dyadobacter tibetensis TaxID=1211851 RepID=UPI0004728E14|nr:Rossmann-like and DUF2520 domain-containing protein [Dyadobacter tibetensis]